MNWWPHRMITLHLIASMKDVLTPTRLIKGYPKQWSLPQVAAIATVVATFLGLIYESYRRVNLLMTSGFHVVACKSTMCRRQKATQSHAVIYCALPACTVESGNSKELWNTTNISTCVHAWKHECWTWANSNWILVRVHFFALSK